MVQGIDKVEITFSDGTQRVFTGDFMVVAVDGDKIFCCATFRCEFGKAKQIAMTMVTQAGKIFAQGVEQEGVEEMHFEEGEEDKPDFPEFLKY